MNTINRNQAIDYAKILATIMVVFYHAIYYELAYYTDTTILGLYVPSFNRIIMNLCSMSIPLFFMCSGFCLLNSCSSSLSKMAKKVAYIVILTIIWNYLTPFPYWFFITLSALYLSTPIQKYLIENKPGLYWLGIGVVFILTQLSNEIYVLSKACDISLSWPNRIQGLFTSYAIVHFAIGYTLSQKKPSVKISTLTILLGMILGIFDGMLLTTDPNKPFDGVNAAFPCLSSLLLAYGVLSLLLHYQNRFTKVSDFLKLCASCCLPIYILHMKFIGLSRPYYNDFNTALEIQPNIYTGLIWSLLICITCGIVGLGIKKIPYLKYLMKL